MHIPYVAMDPRMVPLLPEGLVESTVGLLKAAGLMRRWHEFLLRSRRYRKFGDFMERHTVPGHSLHLALRKRFFDDEVRDAIGDGASQVLVVGAGYDTLCLRLAPRFPGVTFVEIDHPASHRSKKAGLEVMGPMPPNLVLHGEDLARSGLGETLAGLDRWDGAARSAIVAEGVLMYLDATAVGSFLDAVRGESGPESRVLFSYMLVDERGRVDIGRATGLMNATLRFSGEPLRWGVPDRDELARFVQEHGLFLDPSEERCDLRKRYLVPAGLGAEPLGRIERLGVADLRRGTHL